jgi:hypothetical protein
MTLVLPKQITCAVCRATDRYLVLISTNAIGHPDLDLRPPGMARSATLRAILCCKRCSYCAPDLAKGPPTAAATVQSPEYTDLLADGDIPLLARCWACWSLVQEQGADAEGAGWAALQATWVCDDTTETAWAEHFRSRAIELFQEVRQAGGSFAEDHVTEQLLLLDLLRRSGRFEETLRLCGQLEISDMAPDLLPIVRLQRFLAEHEDCEAYTTNDAQEYAQAPDAWHRSPPTLKDRLTSLFRR